MLHIALAHSAAEIDRCFPVMVQLRPHLKAAEFVDRIQRQQKEGYRLAYLEQDNEIRALAGFRISECLAWGKFLYVDDLVTREGDRSHGYGQALLDWLLDYARTHTCEQLHLDSGVQRSDAHRFYFHQRMSITSYHFATRL